VHEKHGGKCKAGVAILSCETSDLRMEEVKCSICVVFGGLRVERCLLRVQSSEVKSRDGKNLVHQKRVFKGNLYNGRLKEIDVTLQVYEACGARVGPEM